MTGKKGLCFYNLGLLQSGLKLNADISKEFGSTSVRKSVSKLSEGLSCVEANQQCKLAFRGLTGQGAPRPGL